MATWDPAWGFPFALPGVHPRGLSGFIVEAWSSSIRATDDGTSLTLAGNGRAYFYVEHSTGSSNPVPINLLGKTRSFTVDVSHVPCGTNAALYFVAMHPSPGEQWATYCDIMSGGNACVEVDIFEANVGAIQSTVHTTTGEGNDEEHCNAWGCSVNWGQNEKTASGVPIPRVYGTGAQDGIDTSRPYRVAATLSEEGEMTVELSQDDRTVPFFNASSAGKMVQPAAVAGAAAGDVDGDTPQVERHFPASSSASTAREFRTGMTLAVSLWGNPGLADWLDHACPDEKRGTVANARATFSDFSIAPTAPPPTPPPPPRPTPPWLAAGRPPATSAAPSPSLNATAFAAPTDGTLQPPRRGPLTCRRGPAVDAAAASRRGSARRRDHSHVRRALNQTWYGGKGNGKRTTAHLLAPQRRCGRRCGRRRGGSGVLRVIHVLF